MQSLTLPILSSSKSSLRQLEKRMASSHSYQHWLELAKEHDTRSGSTLWREETKSSLYDYNEINARHKKLKTLLNAGAHRELLYALNEGIHGNMGGMGRAVLYNRAKAGTKTLIDSYVITIAQAMDCIHNSPNNVISYPDKLDFFRRASHCYGRSALMLSGGAGLIYFHHGVVQELIDHDLLPNVISGASAGSIVSAMLGTKTHAELKAGYFTGKRYEETNNTRLMDVFMGRTTEQQARASRERTLDEVIAMDLTFQEAFEHTGRYINISISPAEKHQSSRLMNAITSPNVFIRSAVAASCSIPGLMPSERLYAKGFDGKARPYLASRRWVDGSVSGDLPAKRLMRLYGVNHFIVSLINPMVVPFIEDVKTTQTKGFRNALTEAFIRVLNEGLSTSEKFFDRRGDMGSRIAAQLAYLIRMLEQNYLGDINILLEKSDFKWRHTVFEFKDGEIENLINIGKRSTWPKIAMIKNAALISKTLDRILEELNQQNLSEQAKGKHHIYT
ncbi:patatin-like phospholipase family protein [Ketobacter alkanivorans]|nr:patatin-like phospholipase family protein [Ketobacter alkanivorans]